MWYTYDCIWFSTGENFYFNHWCIYRVMFSIGESNIKCSQNKILLVALQHPSKVISNTNICFTFLLSIFSDNLYVIFTFIRTSFCSNRVRNSFVAEKKICNTRRFNKDYPMFDIRFWVKFSIFSRDFKKCVRKRKLLARSFLTRFIFSKTFENT